MKVILFGATGMVGQGVLRECLLAKDVSLVCTIGRTTMTAISGGRHAKLQEIVHADMHDYRSIESELSGFDACFFCLGVSSAGMSEEAYAHLTYDLTLAAAGVLARLNPNMVFVYVSGAGTDHSGKGSSMWARVKGRTENALMRLPFKRAYMFRPGAIQPLHGVQSKTTSYRILYSLLKPLLPLLRAALPNQILTTEKMGLAMLTVARRGAAKSILESKDINALCQGAS